MGFSEEVYLGRRWLDGQRLLREAQARVPLEGRLRAVRDAGWSVFEGPLPVAMKLRHGRQVQVEAASVVALLEKIEQAERMWAAEDDHE